MRTFFWWPVGIAAAVVAIAISIIALSGPVDDEAPSAQAPAPGRVQTSQYECDEVLHFATVKPGDKEPAIVNPRGCYLMWTPPQECVDVIMTVGSSVRSCFGDTRRIDRGPIGFKSAGHEAKIAYRRCKKHPGHSLLTCEPRT